MAQVRIYLNFLSVLIRMLLSPNSILNWWFVTFCRDFGSSSSRGPPSRSYDDRAAPSRDRGPPPRDYDSYRGRSGQT